MKILEKQMLSSIRLTDTQKKVLSKIVSAPTNKVAGDQISRGEQMVVARDLLVKLGLITFQNGRAALTDKGQQFAKDEDLVDELGELTDTGKDLAYDEKEKEEKKEQPPTGGLGLGLGVGESTYPLLKEIHILVEGKMKELYTDAENFIQTVLGSRRGDELREYRDEGNIGSAHDVLKKEASERKFSPEQAKHLIPAAMVIMFGGEMEEYRQY